MLFSLGCPTEKEDGQRKDRIRANYRGKAVSREEISKSSGKKRGFCSEKET